MTRACEEAGVTIEVVTSEEEVERVNDFFNSPNIKGDLHWFTYRDTIVRAYERDDRELPYIESDSGEICAALMVWCESRVLDEGKAQIRLVAVSRELRGTGYGQLLCQRAEDFAHNHGQTHMIADVVATSPVVNFWESIGYEPIDEWKTSKDTKMLTVHKKL